MTASALAMNRRGALAALGGGLLAGLLPRPAEATAVAPTAPEAAQVFGAQGGLDAGFWLAAFDGEGRRRISLPLPARGHDTAIDPSGRRAVIVARRPGRFALAVDLASGALEREIAAAPGRHFYGHAVFSPDGALLYTTENDYEAGLGKIGVRDATDGFRWLGELPSHGVGPHQLALLSDGETLVVANGGIRTHPDQGRRKLNLETMEPSLVRLERGSGKLVAARTLPPWYHQLSIRHIAVDAADRVAVAMQHEGLLEDRVPMVAIDRSEDGGDGDLALLRAPAPVERRMRNYCGSVCLDSGERVMAVSHPRGGQTTFWSWPEGEYLSRIEVLDGCGLAPAAEAGRFWISNGRGELILHDATADAAAPQTIAVDEGRYWDNHLTFLAGRP